MFNRTTIPAAALAALLGSTAPAAWAGTTELVSVGSASQQANGSSFDATLSGDGRYVAFQSLATNLSSDQSGDHLYVRDRVAHTTTVVDVSTGGQPGNGYGLLPHISRDGSHVAFFSKATNLVPGDTNNAGDVFERDLKTGTTVRVSVKSNGA